MSCCARRLQDTWAAVVSELKSCFATREAVPEMEPAIVADGATSLVREVSAKVEAEAPEGVGPHELQALSPWCIAIAS